MRIVAAVTMVVLGFLAGCNDGPNKPVRTQEVIYAGASHVFATPDINLIYVYDADSLTLLDSFVVSDFPEQVVTSSDGRYLFVLQLGDPPLVKLDAMTGSVIWTGVNASVPLFLLDHGRMLVSGHAVLNPQTGALIRTLPDTLAPGYGSELGTEVAAMVVNDGTTPDRVVTVLDCATGATRDRFVPYVGDYRLVVLTYVRLHPDGERVFVIGSGPRHGLGVSWVVIGDIKTGETLYFHPLTDHFGEVTISPNDSLAAVTDPPTLLSLNGGGLALLLALDPSPHPLPLESGGGQVRFASDGSRIVVGAAPNLPGGLAIFDVSSLSLIGWTWFPGADSLGLNGPWAGGIDLGMRERRNQ